MKYYSVVCERGHLGRGKSAPLTFAIEAVDAYSAMKQAQKMPAVKHTRIPLSCREITKEDYCFMRNSGSAYHKW